jgi:ArsR family metal-binding transcriptional regulator
MIILESYHFPKERTGTNFGSIIETTPMQIKEFSKLLTCLGDPSKFRMVAKLHPAPGELIKILAPLFEKAIYSQKMNALIIKIQNNVITAYGSGIVTMTRLGDTDQARNLLNGVIDRINQSIKENGLESLRNESESIMHLDPMDLVSYLPRTNCAQCGVKSCFYFATLLAFSEATLEKCKILQELRYLANIEALERLLANSPQVR